MDSLAAQQVKEDIISSSGDKVKPGSFEADAQAFVDESYPINDKTKLSQVSLKCDRELHQMRVQELSEAVAPRDSAMAGGETVGSGDRSATTLENLALKYGDTYYENL